MVQILQSGTQTSPRMLPMWLAPLQPHVSHGQTRITLMTYMYTLFYTYKTSITNQCHIQDLTLWILLVELKNRRPIMHDYL